MGLWSFTNNTTIMTLDLVNDRVGINEANPDSDLEVAGTTHFQGASTFDSNITASGNISGSAASTGSFGHVYVDGGNLVLNSFGAAQADGGRGIFFRKDAYEAGVTTQPSILVKEHAGSNADGLEINAYDGISFAINGTDVFTITNDNQLSGSAASTGSFGRLEIASTGSFGHIIGDGSGITNVTSTVPTGTVSGSAQITAGLPSGVISGSSGNVTIDNTITATSGSISNIQTPLTGRVISNFTEMIKVTVVDDGGSHYAFEGATAPSIQVSEGKTYRFDISDSTVGSHPFRFSTVQDGGHNGGSAYTTGVTVVGTQGNPGAYVDIQITKATVNHLYYYCTAHPGMGNDGKIMKNDLTNLHMVSGSSISTGSFGIIENNTQIAGFRPIGNQTADFSASLSNAGRYHIVHGNLTCSIGTDSDMPVTVGAEYEFFQSSSLGNFLFQTGSGVSLISKNDNMNIAGQGSGATLKKVASNTFHLVGDLT